MPYDKERVACRLKSLRQDKGWKQTDLAKKSGVNVCTIAAIETARTGTGLDTAYDLTQALGCSIEELVCREPHG